MFSTWKKEVDDYVEKHQKPSVGVIDAIANFSKKKGGIYEYVKNTVPQEIRGSYETIYETLRQKQ